MKVPGHLLIEEVKLPAGEEWMDATPAWRFIRFGSGTAYWLGPKLTRPLVEGEVIVAAPSAKGVVRASQLSEALLHRFNFSPGQFCGFLTLAERHFFETQAAAEPGVHFLPSTHPVAQRFAVLAAQPAGRNGMSQRVSVLGLVAMYFQEDFARHRTPTIRSVSALERFKQIVERMPESELVNHSPEDLARLCGCSPRHLNRLFREHLGISVRARQTELRLLKASQLLRETDSKIVHVALESGYRNLGLFNAMFKNRFGMTPSMWRRGKPRKKGRFGCGAAVALSAMLCGLTTLCAQGTRALAAAQFQPPAQEETDTNAIAKAREALRRKMAELNAQTGKAQSGATAGATNGVSATAQTNGPVFAVKGYEIRGNTLLPVAVMDPILQKYAGPAVSFDTIRAALGELQSAYRDRGFVTVAVGLPQQQLTNGLVKVQITEGRLAEINVVNNRYFSSNNVMRALPSLRTNTMLNSLVFQQEADRANASRDRQIYPVIGPGPEPGTSALTLKIKDRLPLHLRLELNNDSTPGTPDDRLNLAATYGNLWQLDHQLGVQYSFTPAMLKPSGDAAPIYDEPLIASYSAYYRMPLGGVNGPPRERDYTVGDFGYDEATHRFRPPPPTGSAELIFYASRSSADTGLKLQSLTLTPPVDFNSLPPGSPYSGGDLQLSDRLDSQSLTINKNLGARFMRPLPEFWGIRSSLSVGLDYKSYRATTAQYRDFFATYYIPSVGTNGPPFDSVQSTNVPSSQQVLNSVEYLPFAIGWEASKTDKIGSTSLNVNSSFNFASLIGNRKDFEAVTGSTNVDGNYFVFTAGLTREQTLYRGWGVRLRADGQWANQPLISNEQFALGGGPGVRGYHDGEVYGDTGWRVQFEPHSPYLNLAMIDEAVPLRARLYGFVDYGRSYLLEPGPRPGAVSLFGAGFGFNAAIGEHIDLRLQLGVPLQDTATTRSGTLRVAFGVGAQF